MNRFPMKRCNPLTMPYPRTVEQYLTGNESSTRPHRQRRRRETRLRASQRVSQHQQRKRINWLRHLGQGAVRILEQAFRQVMRSRFNPRAQNLPAFDSLDQRDNQILLTQLPVVAESQLDLETSASKAIGVTETLRFNPFAKK